MSGAVRIQRNFQVTIPVQIRTKAGLREGDLVEFELREDEIILRPLQLVEKSQSWFWSPEWQREERLVEEDFRKGKVKVSEGVEEFLEELDE